MPHFPKLKEAVSYGYPANVIGPLDGQKVSSKFDLPFIDAFL